MRGLQRHDPPWELYSTTTKLHVELKLWSQIKQMHPRKSGCFDKREDKLHKVPFRDFQFRDLNYLSLLSPMEIFGVPSSLNQARAITE